MTAERYVPTTALRQAVRGRETEVLEALKIAWQDGAPHLTCPYPDHADDHPSWRWDAARARAFCTCLGRGSDSVFDVVTKVEGLDFAAAKRLVTEAGHLRLVWRRRGDFDFIYLVIEAGSASRAQPRTVAARDRQADTGRAAA